MELLSCGCQHLFLTLLPLHVLLWDFWGLERLMPVKAAKVEALRIFNPKFLGQITGLSMWSTGHSLLYLWQLKMDLIHRVTCARSVTVDGPKRKTRSGTCVSVREAMQPHFPTANPALKFTSSERPLVKWTETEHGLILTRAYFSPVRFPLSGLRL